MLYTPLIRTKNAIRFKLQEAQSTWLVIGQTTPWSSPYSDSSPPPDDPTAIGINSPVFAVKATVLWAVEDGIGPYIFKDPNTGLNRQFSSVSSAATMIANEYSLVLLQASVSGATLITLGYSSFRQIGFATDIIPATGFESNTTLTPAQVESWGTLETISNRVPVSLISTSTYVLTELIQF